MMACGGVGDELISFPPPPTLSPDKEECAWGNRRRVEPGCGWLFEARP